jgi:hypothetical protein
LLPVTAVATPQALSVTPSAQSTLLHRRAFQETGCRCRSVLVQLHDKGIDSGQFALRISQVAYR